MGELGVDPGLARAPTAELELPVRFHPHARTLIRSVGSEVTGTDASSGGKRRDNRII
jgi:hypothetical protein